MSKFICICNKNEPLDINPLHSNKLDFIEKRIIPDNILPNPTLSLKDSKLNLNIVNPSNSISIKGYGVCLGKMINQKNNWNIPHGDIPVDGNYSLIRFDSNYLEVITDSIAYRTIWYYIDEDIFIASCSQKAIILYLENFIPNQNIYKWMLSTGSLGPDYSWDKRIKKMEGNSNILLDRNSWKINYVKKSLPFRIKNYSKKEHSEHLYNTLTNVFNNLKIDPNYWYLCLSGGQDSRANLLFLKNYKDLKTITWGTKKAKDDKESDAYIAQKVSEFFHTEHSYLETEILENDIDIVFKRFLIAGEGRIDKISAYIDGFNLWKDLFESGVQGIIRGDQALGCHKIRTHSECYHDMGMTLLDDFYNTKKINKSLSDYKQVIPESLEKNENESFQMWGDRLYYSYRVPVIGSALNNLKLSYTDVISPFFSRSILEKIRELPDHYREDKNLFSGIVNKIGPKIPYATKNSHLKKNDFLRNPEVVKNIKTQFLDSRSTKNIFPNSYINLFKNIKSSSELSFLEKTIIRTKNKYYRHYHKPLLNNNVILFRSFIISKFHDLIQEDLHVLASQTK